MNTTELVVPVPIVAPKPTKMAVNGVAGDAVFTPVRVKHEESVNDAQSGHDHIEEGDSDDESEISEVDSLAQDIMNSMDDLGDDILFEGGADVCTFEEARVFRLELREFGPSEFCARWIESGKVTAKKLMTAFGMRPPPLYEGITDDTIYYPHLGLAISKELSKRLKLPDYNTIDDAVTLLKKSRNIIVLTGAGISTSLGIPDFRSKNGLYNLVKERGLDIDDPQDVFNIETFKRDPTIFFSVAKDILPSTERFTPTHAFIELLQRKGKLLTNYTQNIDNIEAAAGILPEKIVQCHGSFATATCRQCGYKVPGEAIYADIMSDNIPTCQKCFDALPPTRKRKRSKNGKNGTSKKKRRSSDSDSDDDGQYDVPSPGIMKPDITFFGEPLPDDFSDRLTNHDKNLVDLVIVIGTSLKVAPVSEVVPYLPAHVPQMYISMQPVTHVNFDIDLMGECDVVVSELCRRAGWALEHEMIPKNEIVNVTQDENFPSRHTFTSNKTKPDVSLDS